MTTASQDQSIPSIMIVDDIPVNLELLAGLAFRRLRRAPQPA